MAAGTVTSSAKEEVNSLAFQVYQVPINTKTNPNVHGEG